MVTQYFYQYSNIGFLCLRLTPGPVLACDAFDPKLSKAQEIQWVEKHAMMAGPECKDECNLTSDDLQNGAPGRSWKTRVGGSETWLLRHEWCSEIHSAFLILSHPSLSCSCACSPSSCSWLWWWWHWWWCWLFFNKLMTWDRLDRLASGWFGPWSRDWAWLVHVVVAGHLWRELRCWPSPTPRREAPCALAMAALLTLLVALEKQNPAKMIRI